jgi:hypothetical protein
LLASLAASFATPAEPAASFADSFAIPAEAAADSLSASVVEGVAGGVTTVVEEDGGTTTLGAGGGGVVVFSLQAVNPTTTRPAIRSERFIEYPF